MVTALLGAAGLLDAHDFWLVPDAFAVATGGTITTLGQSGTRFPLSESAVSPERVADARLIGSAGTTAITELVQDGKSLRLRHKPPAVGQYLIAVTLQSRDTRAAVAGFKRYLELEGAAGESARLEREGLLGGRDSVSYRSTKYAAAIVEVGTGARVYDRGAGHALEFIPTSDPAELRVGQTAHFRVTAGGVALPGLTVHAGAAADSMLRGRGAPGGGDPDLHLTADAQGVAHVPVGKSGWWNVRAAHVSPRVTADASQWDVHWATFVFHVSDGAGESTRPQRAEGQGSPSDSADVATMMARFQSALASGDSAVALALLAPDAVILESGGVETRDDYRAHHLPADIAFARAVRGVRSPLRVYVQGDVAWATSTSTAQGEFRGRAVNSVAAELVVLTRTNEGWRIRAIHWSSRTRRP